MTGSVRNTMQALRRGWALLAVAMLVTACSGAPAASPTAKPAAAPTQAAAKPAEAAKPTEAAKPAADAAKPAAKDAVKPAAGGVDFAGKTVRIIVGYAPGGGFDSTARILAPHLQEALPGGPTVVVENMPGADSLVAAKTVLQGPVRPEEINIVVYIATLLPKSQLSGGLEGLAPEKESAFLGKPDAAPTELSLCASKSAVQNMESFLNRSRPIKVAALTGASQYDTLLRWTKEVGYPIDIIFGYAGTAQMILAFNQGEADALPACREVDLAQNPDWLEKDTIVPLIYWGDPAESLKKGMAEGKWPWFKHALEAKPITDEQKAVLESWNEVNAGTNVYAMHKQTPPATLAAVQAAFKTAVTNPAFVSEMERRKLQVGYMSAEDIMQTNAEVDAFGPSAKDLIRKMLAI